MTLVLKFYDLNKLWKKNIYIYFFNQLVLDYLFNGIIYFFLIINWLWISEWNKWASLTDILEYSFFNKETLLRYVNNYFSEFISFSSKKYNLIISSFIYDMQLCNNQINIYNIYLFDSLDLFYVLYNVEEFKFEYEKAITEKKKWKDIRKASFNYLNINILNDYFNLSFFSFCVYEFFIIFSEYNLHYLTLYFFEYWVNCIFEKNVILYSNYKENFKFDSNNISNLCIKIFRKNFYSIRVKYNLFLSNIDYFFFIKNFTYNFYIRNCDYFFEFASQRKYFLKYNNPASINRGSLTMWNYDKLYKQYLLFPPNNINDDLNLFNLDKNLNHFFSFNYKNSNKKINYIINFFIKDFNIKFLYKLNSSNNFFSSINKFFNFNLIDFYNIKNKIESYKNVMAVKSVYEYRFANSSFKTMEEFMLTIFKTPLENLIYFDDLYKNFNYIILSNIFSKFEKNFFFENFFNINKKKFSKFYLHFVRFFSKLFKIRIYFFQFGLLWDLIKREKNENLLKIKVFQKFYEFFENKKLFLLLKQIKRKNFNKKWSMQRFFKIIKYNTMFYLDIYSMSILFSGWIYEVLFFFKFMNFVKINNRILASLDSFNNYKYLISFKDFYFQLMIENIDYFLIFIFLNLKKIKIKKNFLLLNKKNKISNNFIYRKYMLYTWLEHHYYSDVFNDLKTFKKEIYSPKLNRWILRYFYNKSELYMFYSESLRNNYINKKRLFF